MDPYSQSPISDYLATRTSGFLTREKAEELLGTTSSYELYDQLLPFLNAGRLAPLKHPVITGPPSAPVHTKYRICTPQASTPSLLNGLNPRLWQQGYLERHPQELQRWHPQLKQLSAWLAIPGNPKDALTERERSFQIFGDEKLLQASLDKSGAKGFSALIKACGIKPDDLGITPAQTTLECYVAPCERTLPLTLLISENRDPWMHVRTLLYENGPGRLFGSLLHGTIYGCGLRVLANGALSDALLHLHHDGPICCLYWGDIDRAGIDIFERLLENAPCPVLPFTPAYQRMLNLAQGRKLPESGDTRSLSSSGGTLTRVLSESERWELQRILNERLRLPQEILTQSELEEGWLSGAAR